MTNDICGIEVRRRYATHAGCAESFRGLKPTVTGTAPLRGAAQGGTHVVRIQDIFRTAVRRRSTTRGHCPAFYRGLKPTATGGSSLRDSICGVLPRGAPQSGAAQVAVDVSPRGESAGVSRVAERRLTS